MGGSLVNTVAETLKCGLGRNYGELVKFNFIELASLMKAWEGL